MKQSMGFVRKAEQLGLGPLKVQSKSIPGGEISKSRLHKVATVSIRKPELSSMVIKQGIKVAGPSQHQFYLTVDQQVGIHVGPPDLEQYRTKALDFRSLPFQFRLPLD